MLKEQLRESEQAVTKIQAKWRNHVFDKNGKVHLGIMLWDTRKDAENAFQSLKATIVANMENKKRTVCKGLTPELKGEDYSWHMQIPVLQP